MDKPLETDPEDLFEDESEDAVEDQQVADPSDDNSEEADENVQGDEEGKEESDALTLSREDIEQMTGRKFESKEDFQKHYKNLNSFVGKKTEKKRSTKKSAESQSDANQELLTRLEALEQERQTEKFLNNKPQEAKDNLDLIQAYADAKQISLEDAWEEKKSLFVAAEDVNDIKSTNRIVPIQKKDLKRLEQQAKNGSVAAQEQLVRQMLHSDE